MINIRVAETDPSLRATVVTRTPLTYATGSDPAADRPTHVRAASSLAWVGSRIALVQDDANFVAIFDPHDARVHAIELPRGHGGFRQFDDIRGNKRHKLDLEACLSIDTESGPLLLAFGSGSTTARRNIAMLDQWDTGTPRVTLADATSLYERLQAETTFAGSDMNIEGAVLVADVVRLFGRGNGASRNGGAPRNATCDLALPALLDYLGSPTTQSPPAPTRIVNYALGAVDGTPLGFTDATCIGQHVLYCAAAEQSADATVDGPVAGSALGIIAPSGEVRYALLTDASGAPLFDKVEGVLLATPHGSTASNDVAGHAPMPAVRVYVVIDCDEPSRPSELCEVELSGPWRTPS